VDLKMKIRQRLETGRWTHSPVIFSVGAVTSLEGRRTTGHWSGLDRRVRSHVGRWRGSVIGHIEVASGGP
jgi:hypothetical protein